MSVPAYPDWWANWNLNGLSEVQQNRLEGAKASQCPKCGRHAAFTLLDGAAYTEDCRLWTAEAMTKREKTEATSKPKPQGDGIFLRTFL